MMMLTMLMMVMVMAILMMMNSGRGTRSSLSRSRISRRHPPPNPVRAPQTRPTSPGGTGGEFIRCQIHH